MEKPTANLASEIKEEKRKEIATRVCNYYDTDKDNRKDCEALLPGYNAANAVFNHGTTMIYLPA